MAKIINIRVMKGEGVHKDSGVYSLRYAGDFKDCKSWEEADEEWKEIIKASPDKYMEKSDILLQIEDEDGELLESLFTFKVNNRCQSEYEEGLKAKIIELLKYSIKTYRKHHICSNQLSHAERVIKLLEAV